MEEALAALPGSPSASRSSPSTTARKDATPAIADRLAAAHPDVVRAVHHPTNLGYGAALRSGFRAARYGCRLLHRRRPPVPGRRPRPADRPPAGAGCPRTSSSATGSGGRTRRSGRSTRASTGSPTGSGSASGSATWTAPASSSGARRWPASGSNRAARSSPRSCSSSSGRGPDDRRGGRPPLSAHGRLPDGREAVRHLARGEGLLGRSACACGRTGPGALRRGEPIVG